MWYHGAWVYNGRRLKFYLDGILMESESASGISSFLLFCHVDHVGVFACVRAWCIIARASARACVRARVCMCLYTCVRAYIRTHTCAHTAVRMTWSTCTVAHVTVPDLIMYMCTHSAGILASHHNCIAIAMIPCKSDHRLLIVFCTVKVIYSVPSRLFILYRQGYMANPDVSLHIGFKCGRNNLYFTGELDEVGII